VKALIREAGHVRLVEVPAPAIVRDDDVIVRVIVAGICRTDLHVACGAVPSVDPITLGHEFCGRVVACGSAANVALGALVSADPRIDGGFLGVTHHGAFADCVRVPAANVHAVGELDPRVGAYVEPVAAALAVVPHVAPGLRVAVFGSNRFSELVRRVLRAEGRGVAAVIDGPIARASIDVGIETSGTARELTILVDALRPEGVLILKSRNPGAVPLPVGEIVAKQLAVRGAHYGAFAPAIELLSKALDVSDLIGDAWPLAQHVEAFARARHDEAQKLFLRPDTPCAE
jgi:threonine dehydrogenase-like Zn-dependent dehydrogenase